MSNSMTEEIEYKLTLTIWYNGLETDSMQIARAIHKLKGVTTVLLLAKTEISKRDNIVKKFEYPDLARGL